MVEDLDGVEVIMDDVIMAADESTHDQRLHEFLERASAKGFKKLNKEKCKIEMNNAYTCTNTKPTTKTYFFKDSDTLKKKRRQLIASLIS